MKQYFIINKIYMQYLLEFRQSQVHKNHNYMKRMGKKYLYERSFVGVLNQPEEEAAAAHAMQKKHAS